jgi:hypothetical protein
MPGANASVHEATGVDALEAAESTTGEGAGLLLGECAAFEEIGEALAMEELHHGDTAAVRDSVEVQLGYAVSGEMLERLGFVRGGLELAIEGAWGAGVNESGVDVV